MRKALNDNPIVQVGAVVVLVLIVAVMFLTRMGSTQEDAAATAANDSDAQVAVESAAVAATAAQAQAQADVVAAGEFVAGPGLPKAVVKAHDDGQVVVLLFIREGGIDDALVRQTVNELNTSDEVVLFEEPAANVGKYSRITTGVDLSRVPALVVVQPGNHVDGAMPAATVSYGFRGPDSIRQAVNDILYEGKRYAYSPRPG